MRPVTHIVIHHSAGSDREWLDWNAIREEHLQRGWDDIGYHFGIEWVNGAFEILAGRPIRKVGAGVEGHNTGKVHVCLIGNFEETHPRPAMIDRAVALLSDLCEVLHIPASRDTIKGHREFAPTLCPGKFMPLDDLAALVAREIA